MPASPFDPSLSQASTLCLPVGCWATVLDCLADHFPAVGRAQWADRFARGRVLDAQGQPLGSEQPYRAGLRVHYYREVPVERPIPVQERVLFEDEHLLIADKPHFLPVTPAGEFVEQTLLRRLIRSTGNAHLVPLHRIDRHTAGLVMFSTNPATRGPYQQLFPTRRIEKTYEAVASALPHLAFPHVRRSRIARGEPFFCMREVDGEPNSETRIEVASAQGAVWHYRLFPVTGRTHQLRVHMAGLGAPICNDPFYPSTAPAGEPDNLARPLQLLARALAFNDPLTGEARSFQSQLGLQVP
ncbi:pseudouridine synthase [Pseudomonas sp. RIT-PI-S]|uniref:pseudouridine synthase n=1 Tax=Pseudomonas sp. RIT-PI-S TaxID=3035295 RepID=UPI0021DAA640|nr:pseudouridine synthase [Pseudomonas sp. RIT-PI-S]